MKNQLKAGVLISYLSLLVSNIIPLVYTPIMLRILGQAEYGVYGIASSISNYLYLLNMGLGGTIIRYLSKYRASGEREKEEQIAGMFVQIYSVLSVIILVVGLFLTTNIHLYGNALTADELETLKKLVFLFTINTAFFMPFNVMGSILVAHEEFVVNKGVALVMNIATPFLNLAFLFAGFGSVGLVLVLIITNFIGYCVYTYDALCRVKIRPRFGKPDWPILREIFGYTIFVFLGRVVDMLYWSTDRLIIGWSIGAVSTAVYNIGAVFHGHVSSFASTLSNILIPKLTQMEVKNAPATAFTEVFIRIGRLQYIIVAFIISAFASFGRQFIALWAGPGYEESFFVAIFTMIPAIIGLIQNTGVNILYARNKHQFRVITHFFAALINLTLTWRWIHRYGIVGAAFATCIASILHDGLLMNWYYHKRMQIDIPLFWKNIIRMSPLALTMGTAAWFVLERINMNSWPMFFALAVAYTVIYLPLAYVFIMNDYERRLIMEPIRKLRTAVSGKKD